ncbi:MAG: mobile mystery protein B [Chlorobiaceae bacterium]|nr:mobile mystery protein B [Chlorobiaceae bacterium]
MGLDLDYLSGKTPLDEDEKDGLLFPTKSTRQELDEFEQQNIEQAMLWSMKRNFRQEYVFSEKFIRELHRRMYGRTWSWAGEFRKSNKNIGVDKREIGVELRKLCDDALFWISGSIYVPDDIAVRFKHRLVSIHCFPNGNGRHSRLMADIIINKIFRQPVFDWGRGDLTHDGDIRGIYLKAIRAADAGNYDLLTSFARSGMRDG